MRIEAMQAIIQAGRQDAELERIMRETLHVLKRTQRADIAHGRAPSYERYSGDTQMIVNGIYRR